MCELYLPKWQKCSFFFSPINIGGRKWKFRKVFDFTPLPSRRTMSVYRNFSSFCCSSSSIIVVGIHAISVGKLRNSVQRETDQPPIRSVSVLYVIGSDDVMLTDRINTPDLSLLL